MNATNRYLDALAKELGGVSDYRLSKVLGKQPSAISHYRHGRSTMDPKTCFQVAELLGIDPATVVAAVEADRAARPEDRAYWSAWLGKAAAVLVIGILLQGAPSGEARASTASAKSPDFTGYTLRAIFRAMMEVIFGFLPGRFGQLNPAH